MNGKRHKKRSQWKDIVGNARSVERNERTAEQGSLSIGRSRSGLPEGVCEKAVASQRPGDGATTAERRAAVSCSRKGNEFSQSPVPTPTWYCSDCRAAVRRGVRSGEC